MRCNARDCADSATGSRRARSKLRPRCCVPRCRTASPHVRVDAWVYRRKFSATSATPDPASAAALLGQREAEGIDARPAFGEHHAAVHLRHRRSEEHTSELQSLMRISYAVFCLKKKKKTKHKTTPDTT